MQGLDKAASEYRKGVVYALAGYIMWGFFPIYWRAFKNISSYEILAERVVWAFAFMIVMIAVSGNWQEFMDETKTLLADKKQTMILAAAGVCVTLNWLGFIVAVNMGKTIQTSLGYYINPLVSILFGVYYFKERLNIWTKISFVLATIGVLTMSVMVGEIPWISLFLAASFGIYGLLKKQVKVSVVTGLTLETLVATPVCFGYIAYLYAQGVSGWQVSDNFSLFLLAISGAVTATPLLAFNAGAKRLPLNVVGFLQYVCPTISLIIGIFVFHEEFTASHFLAFAFIWLALLIFSLSQTKFFNSWVDKLVGSRV